MMKYICDASVLLAYLRKETGWQMAEKYLASCVVSSVNFSELIAKIVEFGGDAKDLKDKYSLVDFNREIAFLAGELRKETKQYGLSLADRACIATAILKKIPAVTADKDWLALKIKGLKVICIR